jgi:IclR family transcriptional regulator, mhp operon transcriptional activator
LLQRIVWPSDLTTPDGDSMIIRETTHRFSPLSFHRSMVGRRLPMLLTASGRIYFASCQDAEREDILDLLRTGAGGEQQQRLASDDAFIRNLVRRTRADGFGSNHGDWTEQRKIGSLAVAVSAHDRVMAALNVIYLEHAINPADAVRRFLPSLQHAAQEMTSALDAPGN